MKHAEVPDWPTTLPPAARARLVAAGRTHRDELREEVRALALVLGGDRGLAHGLSAVVTLADELQAEHAARLRDAGASWSQVADEFGVTRQAAQKRFA